MDYERTKSFLKQIGQSHLLEYYDELDAEKRRILLEEIQNVNFSVVENLKNTREKSTGEIRPVQAKTLSDIAENYDEYYKEGLRLLKENKVGAVLLAGGQGTRLGYDKPKGTFDIGETHCVTIFSLLMQCVNNVARLAENCFPLFIMTSSVNNEQTVNFFKENNFFGYPEEKIHFFIQDTEPACDKNGKIYLAEKHRVCLSPNGNGGWYSSLINSGLNRVIKSEGVEWLNVFGVDNVLQKICDPAFIGATHLSGCACSSKVVSKTCAEEKVGVLCERDGKPSIIEYYEMPPELARLKDGKGQLVYRYGVILNYLFNVKDLDKILTRKLPYHIAEKAVPHIENGVLVKPAKPDGYKFETLVVDMVKLMGSCLAYEVEREKEFAPVKNKTGTDSVDSARALLKLNGIKL